MGFLATPNGNNTDERYKIVDKAAEAAAQSRTAAFEHNMTLADPEIQDLTAIFTASCLGFKTRGQPYSCQGVGTIRISPAAKTAMIEQGKYSTPRACRPCQRRRESLKQAQKPPRTPTDPGRRP